MNRRSFLKSIAALAATPGVAPLAQALGAASSAGASAGATVPASTYKWAETIVRAHRSCTTAMLQRHLRLDAVAAKALQQRLIANGVVSAQANAYGIRAATKPLTDAAFLRPNAVSFAPKSAMDNAKHILDIVEETSPEVSDNQASQHLAAEMREADDMDCECALTSSLGDSEASAQHV